MMKGRSKRKLDEDKTSIPAGAASRYRSECSKGGRVPTVVEDDDSFEEEIDLEQVAMYEKQLDQSEGFDVDFYPNIGYHLSIIPMCDKKKKSYAKELQYCMESAIRFYEERRDVRLTDAKLIKENMNAGCNTRFYITFTAKEMEEKGSSDAGQETIRTYQARVFCNLCENMEEGTEVEMVRPKDDIHLAVLMKPRRRYDCDAYEQLRMENQVKRRSKGKA